MYQRRSIGLRIGLYLFAGLSLLACAVATAAPAYFLSYPDLRAGSIAFVYQNDLWLAAANGTAARRLTADGRPKTDVHLSHDGSRVAFSMTVDGNPDVYVIGIGGGPAVRVTHHPALDRVLGWYPDDRQLLISSRMATAHAGVNALFKVTATGGLPEPLPLAYGETAALAADARSLVYTAYRDFQDESWKRYRGGRAPHLLRFDFDSGVSHQITDGEWSDSAPIWIGDTVYFLSERGPEHRGNLWSLSLKSGTLAQLTHYTDFDVRHPSGSAEGIVFERGTRIGMFDLGSQQARELAVEVPAVTSPIALHPESAAEELETAALVPGSGDTVVSAHGELFLVGLADKPVINMTRTSGAAERFPSVSADGKRLAYFSDETGEYQLYIRDLPAGPATRVTNFSSGLRFRPAWSPDNRHLAFIDSQHDISIVDLSSSKVTVIDRDLTREPGGLDDFRSSWSPDGRWLAYSRALDSGNYAVFLYDLSTASRIQVSSGEISELHPVFDAGGRFLFVAANQSLKPTFGDIDSTWTYADSMQLVALSLQAGTKTEWSKDCKCLEYDRTKPKPMTIDLEGLDRRRTTLATPRGVFADLHTLPGKLVYRRIGPEAEGQSPSIEALDLISGHTQSLASKADELLDIDASRGALLRRGTHLVLRGFDSGAAEQELPTKRMTMVRDRSQENAQQLLEAWRYARDFFYDANMQGANWQQVRDRYLPLAKEARIDEDMSYIVKEVAGELAAGHVWAYSGHGHPPGWADACVGLLGVDFSVEQGAYRIQRILDGGLLAGEAQSPLAAQGSGVHAGMFLLAVNGQRLSTQQDPWAAFEGLCDSQVQLTVSDTTNPQGARNVEVHTMRSEARLREADWANRNRERVHQLSGGRLGYIYVPDTGGNGQTELVRQYRAEFRRQGVVVDERFNRGGAFGDRLVELLNRPPLGFFATRNAPSVPLPELANSGPKALLINGWCYSGGDGFPFLFHSARAGTIIGTPTAGGYIGPGNPMRLVSGGVISAPPQRAFGVDGWAGNGGGMPPDVLVDINPADLARGRDNQLESAVSYLLNQVQSHPSQPIPAPNPPSQNVWGDKK
jgi:tricorn protease